MSVALDGPDVLASVVRAQDALLEEEPAKL
jgi:hypothetical protein